MSPHKETEELLENRMRQKKEETAAGVRTIEV